MVNGRNDPRRVPWHDSRLLGSWLDGGNPAFGPHDDWNPLSNPVRRLEAELGGHGISMDLDVALYDQWASESTSGVGSESHRR